MRLGVCASMIAPERDSIGIESVAAAAGVGFDYVELSLAHLAALPEAEFEGLVKRMARAGLHCEACNNFFPPPVRLTGPDANLQAALDYAAAALARAAWLGVEVVVLGSSGAKNIPAGFPAAEARRQFLALLRGLAPCARQYGITIVLEAISRPEANFINLAGEALALVHEVDHPGVRLLMDYYHLATEAESPGVIREAGLLIRHVHFAQPAGRAFPVAWDAEYQPFFRALQDIDYGGRLSIEAYTSDFPKDAPRALAMLRAAANW